MSFIKLGMNIMPTGVESNQS